MLLHFLAVANLVRNVILLYSGNMLLSMYMYYESAGFPKRERARTLSILAGGRFLQRADECALIHLLRTRRLHTLFLIQPSVLVLQQAEHLSSFYLPVCRALLVVPS